ncbi:MAG TPA: 4Fe-4S dicluster domain-containing protein, partial [Planctomycetota bacterium]|nr:4Fe-4S dicluster domain-containing protein [Planctomycetota bacterium]
MKFGFVIDQRKCIGCHACTVACKSENEVPVGSFRTWVKYVDKGAFPTVRRHFTVLRCNHCDEAPCVEICPVNALHKRPDAIVDLNRDVCIGCRACMQACPYDALYLNEDTGTAEKCHYCAHRTEVGLEPACVVVCPERAIVAGDVEDPGSGIATLLRDQPTAQRKVEKGTKPRVWYVDALPEALVPGTPSEPDSYLWSDRRLPPPRLPDSLSGPKDLWTTLDVAHPPAWGWHIWVYLLTKNICA